MANWFVNEPRAIPQAIEDISTTQKLPLGTVIKGRHETHGEAQFIYLLGVASTVAGSWVTFNPDDWSTTRIVPNAIGPVAVAMGANVASSYGWYMTYGKHPSAKAADVADNGKVYIDTLAGICDDAVVAGDKVHNAKWASADETVGGTAEVEIAYPFVTDEST